MRDWGGLVGVGSILALEYGRWAWEGCTYAGKAVWGNDGEVAVSCWVRVISWVISLSSNSEYQIDVSRELIATITSL